MKAVIPLAGKGTRLRPHTYVTPKPLLRVAGRPVLAFVLDDLLEAGVEEVVFVVGYMGEVIRRYVAREYPRLRAAYVEQPVQDGTAGALRLVRPHVDGELLILFADTLLEADLSLIRRVPREWGGVVWAHEVEDYRRYGVIVTDGEGFVTRIVEKPAEPISHLANVGLHYVRDTDLLFQGIEATYRRGPGPGGEFYLTDALQYMVDQGARIFTARARGWYDCGKPETLIATNRHLLEAGLARAPEGLPGVVLREPVRVEEGAAVERSEIGPNVTVEGGARITASRIRDTIVGAGAVLERVELHGSLVGAGAVVKGYRGSLSVADHSEVVGSG